MCFFLPFAVFAATFVRAYVRTAVCFSALVLLLSPQWLPARFAPVVQGEPVSLAQVDRLDLQFTYLEGDMYYFMDTSTFEEVSIDKKIVGDKAGFMLEGMNLSVSAGGLEGWRR